MFCNILLCYKIIIQIFKINHFMSSNIQCSIFQKIYKCTFLQFVKVIIQYAWFVNVLICVTKYLKYTKLWKIINRHTHKYQPDLYVVVFCHIGFRILKEQKHILEKKYSRSLRNTKCFFQRCKTAEESKVHDRNLSYTPLKFYSPLISPQRSYLFCC